MGQDRPVWCHVRPRLCESLLRAHSVGNGRDGWAWAQYAIGVIAGLTAIVAFLYWIREQRRRPEAEFLWKLSTNGRPEDLREWKPDEVPVVPPGSALLVEVSMRNIGDALGRSTVSNFVVGSGVDVTDYQHGRPSTAASNAIVGRPPDYACRFIAGAIEWYPQLWWLQRFVVIPNEGTSGDLLRLLMEVEDDRLNSSGRRWLPNLLWNEPTNVNLQAGARWPPERRGKRRLGRIRSLPTGRASCRPGQRRDVRDIAPQ
jgi:hypothetical protein